MSGGSDDIERKRARMKKTLAIRASMTTFSDILDEVLGKELRQHFRDNLVARGNTPSVEKHFVHKDEWRRTGSVHEASDRIWVADRILEFQTIGQFLVVAMGHLPLPTGEIISQPLDQKEWFQLTKPYSDWAPSPYDAEVAVPVDKVTSLVGSMDDSRRIQVISKELQAMKSRLWEGIMPLSTRRWKEKNLYDPKNFSKACRILSMVINVFTYLNLNVVQAALRETFVLIDEVLRTFEVALNSKRSVTGEPGVEVSKKWHQFIRSKYAVMVNRTHNWVTGHVRHMKDKVLEQLLEAYASSHEFTKIIKDEEFMRIRDMWQDLCEITAQADYTIFMSMDRYDGSATGPRESRYNFRTQPLRMAVDIKQRNLDYHARRDHFNQRMDIDDVVAKIGIPKESALDKITGLLRRQDAAQQLVRAELRGEPVQYEQESWVAMIRDEDEWGFVIYRFCHSCTDNDWDTFRARFDADEADWGSELLGVGALRERSKLYWLDTQGMGIDDGDIEALKSSFTAFVETADFPARLATDIFLVADGDSVASYLSPPTVESLAADAGDVGGFVCAVEASFDPAEGADRPEESPGYSGTLRVLGSLLWDDLSAVIASRAQSLEGLWPLAMNHPSHVYVGPVVEVHK